MDQALPGEQVRCFTPQGRLDALTVPKFEGVLRDHLSRGTPRVVVNLTNVTYISSSGLRALLTARRLSKSQGGDVKLCQLSPRVYEIFEMVGFTQVFGIYDSVEAAEAAFA
jgi:serine/threonine-protein kinase RsbW